jgi:M6 family metalloprotease-like protein
MNAFDLGKLFSRLLYLTVLTLELSPACQAQTTPSPWGVLLCKIKSDATGRFDPTFEPPNASGVLPFRTVCTNFFTRTDAGNNAVRFFSDMSHGKLDLSGSQVLGWYTIDVNVTGYDSNGDPLLDKSQGEVVALAKQAATDAGVSINSFVGVVVILNLPTGWAQGTPGWMAADWRRVDGRNLDGTLTPRGGGGGNGIEIFGQEMGHGYGLDHSRRDGSTVDYQDPWDIMSTAAAWSAPDANYCAIGPGLNAWNMRGRNWLDESRVWKDLSESDSQVIQLRPLHRRDLPGFLAAELPSTGTSSAYLVEFRMKEIWDAAIPRPAILVHRFEGQIGQPTLGSHSYIMAGTRGQQDLVAGDVFYITDSYNQYSKVEVLNIDGSNRAATVRLSFRTSCFPNAPVLSVPSQYSTVRAAYNAAGSGCSIIRINTGTYHETPMPFTLMSKQLRLESHGGPVTIQQ